MFRNVCCFIKPTNTLLKITTSLLLKVKKFFFFFKSNNLSFNLIFSNKIQKSIIAEKKYRKTFSVNLK
jgi:hypothetical protein